MANDPYRPVRPVRPAGGRGQPSARRRQQPTVLAGEVSQTDTDKTSMGADAAPGEAFVLRSGTPPADQLDFDDRHDTRATEDEGTAKRYEALRRDYRKDDWHHTAMKLIGRVVMAAVYLAIFVTVLLLPFHLSARSAMEVAGLASLTAGGGVTVAIRPPRRPPRQRHDRSWDR